MRARRGAGESGAAVGPGPQGAGTAGAKRGARVESVRKPWGDVWKAPSAAEARVGCVDELGDLAAGVADELFAALAILFATLER